jgi:AP-1 complex subunit gamma-1
LQQGLVQVATWCIGEFGDMLIGSNQEVIVNEKDVIELFERIMKSPLTTSTTKDYIITAAIKLTTRFSSSSLSLVPFFLIFFHFRFVC